MAEAAKERPAVALGHRALADPAWGWSLGSYGALAEFVREPDDGGEIILLPDGGRAVARKGALSLSLPADARPVAYETLSRHPQRWQHGVAICVDEGEAEMHRRARLTEVGPDAAAIRPEDRGAVLFDLGLGVAAVDAHVRTRDRDLLAVLARAEGTSVLSGDAAVMREIVARSPHRVFVSRLGRLEVYQAIDRTRSPSGPHTHVLPRLLRAGRSHSANVPLPQGLVGSLTVYPPNPVLDALGRSRPYDRGAHEAFQALLLEHGPPALVAAKLRAIEAVRLRKPPDDPNALGRAERTAVRVALRQLRHAEGASPSLDAWRAAFEPMFRRAA
jgi:hypothetical protein